MKNPCKSEIRNAVQSKQPAQAGDTPVGRRPPASEDMGMVARFQPGIDESQKVNSRVEREMEVPATHQSDRSTFSTISGNSWGLLIHLSRGCGFFFIALVPEIGSSILGLTRLVTLYNVYIGQYVYLATEQAETYLEI